MRYVYQVIQIDLGNLQNFEINGFQYFMVAVDMFSRSVFLRAMKDRTEGEINKAFQSIHKEVKNEMKTLRSDNEFISASFKKYLKDNNIRQVLGTPNTPHSQGVAEKFVGLTKRVISAATLSVVRRFPLNDPSEPELPYPSSSVFFLYNKNVKQ